MADKRRSRSPSEIASDARGGGQERGGGRYQVWHADDFRGMIESRIEREPYVHGYTHVADVQAAGLAQAFEMTSHGETPWPQNPGVQALADDPRSTYFGDLIIDPAGRPYRVEEQGFSEIQGAKRWRSPSEIAAEARGGGPERGDGKGWVELEEERERNKQGGNTEGGNQRGRRRSLPEEQRQRQKEQERDKGHSLTELGHEGGQEWECGH